MEKIQDQNKIENIIEALLFFNADPIKISTLSKYLNTSQAIIKQGIESLENSLANRGIKLAVSGDSVALVTCQEASEIINNIQKEEAVKDLSKAALETLSIIMYRNPIKRSEIDYIRGVNSQFTLRLLLIRGLIEKETSQEDERVYLYKPSFDLLNLLGIQNISTIPDFVGVNNKIDEFINSNNSEQNIENE